MKTSPFLLSPNCINPLALRNLRKAFDLTQVQLAAKSDIKRDTIAQIERQKSQSIRDLRTQSARTIEELAKALEVDLERESHPSIIRLTERLFGAWKGYHLSKRQHEADVEVISTELEITSQHDVVLRHKESNLTYKGTFLIEAPGRLLFELKTSQELAEHTVWRFTYPIATDFEQMSGYWMGVDFWQHPVTSPAFLIKMPKDKESPPLDLSDEEIRDRLRKVPNHCARLTQPSDQSEIEWYSEWNESLVDEAFALITHGEEITLLTSYYPHEVWLYNRLERLEKRIRREKIRDVHMRVLLMNPKNDALLAARTDILQGLSRGELKRKILRQERTFKSEQLSGCRVDVYFFDQWFSGMSISVGKRFFAVGYLFANISAANGPMAVCRDSGCETWRCFADEFEALWDKNRPVPKNEV